MFESSWATKDVKLTTAASSGFWQKATPVFAEKNLHDKIIPGSKLEVRSRWTASYLYVLFICPYQQLYLKPSPEKKKETNELWKWDVAEIFIGSDFEDIKRYKEFEVSPQGEWIDLDVDLHNPHHEDGWVWNSGFESAARVDPAKHLWYAAMKIPMSALLKRQAEPGTTFRANLFLSVGPPTNHREIAWQSPMGETFHAPAHFGLLKLVR